MTSPSRRSDKPTPLDDAAIVLCVRNGAVDAFEVLVERHSPHVSRLVARNVPIGDVAEVAHDAFVGAFISLANYEPTRAFEHWLTRITLRTCSDYWRRTYRDRDRSTEELGDLAAEQPTGQADDRELLAWALDALAFEDRQALTLVYFEGRSTKECAEVLKWSESKVKIRAHRARLRLREVLERALPELWKRP